MPQKGWQSCPQSSQRLQTDQTKLLQKLQTGRMQLQGELELLRTRPCQRMLL